MARRLSSSAKSFLGGTIAPHLDGSIGAGGQQLIGLSRMLLDPSDDFLMNLRASWDQRLCLSVRWSLLSC